MNIYDLNNISFCVYIIFFTPSKRFLLCFKKILPFPYQFMHVLAGEDMGNISKWKEFLAERTASRKNVNLMQLVYGKPVSESSNEKQNSSEKEESEDDEFFKPKGEGNKVCPCILPLSHTRTCTACFCNVMILVIFKVNLGIVHNACCFFN